MYSVVFVSPVIICVVSVLPALVSVPPAGVDVMVYPVIVEFPLFSGALKVIVACVSPLIAVTSIGASGATMGVARLVVLFV